MTESTPTTRSAAGWVRRLRTLLRSSIDIHRQSLDVRAVTR